MRTSLQDLSDSQVEITLLRSCLALPKVSVVLRACPPSHIQQSSSDFDQAIRDIVGGPLSDWSWLKASLSIASKHLVERILSHPPSSTLYTIPVVRTLATTAAHPDWQNIDNIDVPLRQRSLLMRLPSRTYSLLPPPSAHELWHTLPHAGDWRNVVPSTSLMH